MRALIQRVSEASVTVDGILKGAIGAGLCVFLGVKHNDTAEDAEQLAEKIARLRIFPDESYKMNRSLLEQDGELLVIPQFTLYADTSKGNRPSYSEAARPEVAETLYESFARFCRLRCRYVATGVFRAHMQIRLINDGPVTVLCSAGE
ncbi:MAG TPA: D-aminoacyl-tRNA deacylase [Bryobacteraceae bacterium]|jgi:D-tyrosyl-tRNA(Tyr) deacylase|nr:D-aminoacyl-tRNA deacylase [Bryobacteraceae bacterium]